MNANKLNLIYKIVSEYIHDNAWSDKDIERLSKLTSLEIVEEMKEDGALQCECPCCLMQGINVHSPDCLLAELLRKE